MPSPSSNLMLLEAAAHGDLERLDWALDHKANPNVRSRQKAWHGQTALHRVLGNNLHDAETLVAVVERLLAAGANPNLVDGHGRTPATLLFDQTASHALQRLLPLLLEHGLRLDGGTPDRHVAQVPVFQCMRWLNPPPLLDTVLAHGGSLEQRDAHGDTPLLYLARRNSRQVRINDHLAEVLERGAEVNALSRQENGSPLTILASTLVENEDGHLDATLDAVQRLLAAGADPRHAQRLITPSGFGGRLSHASPHEERLNRPLGDGYTALHFAAWYGAQAVCDALLAAGASATARTSTPYLPCTGGFAAQRKAATLDATPGEPVNVGLLPRELALLGGHAALAARLEGAELAAELGPSDGLGLRPRSRL